MKNGLNVMALDAIPQRRRNSRRVRRKRRQLFVWSIGSLEELSDFMIRHLPRAYSVDHVCRPCSPNIPGSLRQTPINTSREKRRHANE